MTPRTESPKRVDPSRFLTTAEVLARYHISRRTLDRIAARDEAPVYNRPGSRMRYWDPDDLDALWQPVER
jgi:predicted DNA-binding transcriptional regulator AlpA